MEALQRAKSLHDLAIILRYKPKALSYLLYKAPEGLKYSEFEIPKKSGETRTIQAPNKKLKLLQRRLASILYQCIEEHKPNDERLVNLSNPDFRSRRSKKAVSHGFQQGLSIASNASRHIRKKYVFNIDLEDFFPSINFGRVRGFFIKNHRFRLQPKVATIIAQIACHNNTLPQGSPCSPVISNLIAEILDSHVVRLAKQHGCTYTRYADDLTFSTNQLVFPKQIAYRNFWKNNEWSTGKELKKLVVDSGFAINEKKSHMQFSDSRQLVTGLTVNRVVNTKSEYYRYARSMCHSLFMNGSFTLPRAIEKKSKIGEKESRIRWYQRLKNVFLKKANSANLDNPVKAQPSEEGEGKINQLEGILNHIYFIKSYRNTFANPGYRSSRHDGYRKEKDKNGNHAYPPKNRCNQYSDESHQVAVDGIKNLYGRFLFFKFFHFLDKPLIFCEGKTDNVYLKCAVRQLVATYPDLATKNGDNIEFKIDFFNRSKITSEMLKLADGTSGMKYVLLEYHRIISSFKCKGKKYPVIMIVDADSAGNSVVNAKAKHDSTRTSIKHNVTDNLYLLQIPKIGSGDTEMEDLFDSTILTAKLDGKTFNRNNSGLQPSKEYGKDHFAKYVIKKNQDSIDFESFKPLLDDVVEVIKSHVYPGSIAK